MAVNFLADRGGESPRRYETGRVLSLGLLALLAPRILAAAQTTGEVGHDSATECSAWQGQTIDSKGRPIPGAAVRSAEQVVTTNRTGHFRLEAASAEKPIRIDANGYKPWRRVVPCAEREDLTRIPLVTGAVVGATLLASDGSPVETANLEIERRVDGDRRRRSRLELELDEGRFRVALPGPGDFSASLSGPDFVRVNLGELSLEEASELDLGTLIVERGAGVEALFLDRESAEAVAGAQVEIEPVGRGWIEFSARGEEYREISGGDGRVRISGLEAGRYVVRYSSPRGQRGVRIVSLKRSEVRDLGTIWVDQGAQFHGRVVQRTGEPVVAEPVQLLDRAAEVLEPFARTITAEDGRFRFVGLEPAEYLVRIGGETVRYSALESIERGAEAREIVLSSLRIRGRAKVDGLPLAHATLTLQHGQDLSESRQKVVYVDESAKGRGRRIFGAGTTRTEVSTDADGSFSSDDLLPGEVSATWQAGISEVVRWLELPNADEALVDLEFGGFELRGFLPSAAAPDATSAIVSAFDSGGRRISRALVKPGGEFLLGGLPEGPIDLEARLLGQSRVDLRGIRPGEQSSPLVVAVPDGSSRDLEVTMESRADVGPANPELVALSPAGALAGGALVVGTGAVIRKLAPGSYFLAWNDPTYGAGARRLALDAGTEPMRIDLDFDGAGGVEVECSAVRFAREPIELLRVRTRQGGDVTAFLSGVVPGLRFSEACRVALGRLSTGSYEIELRVAGESSRRSFSIDDGEELTLRFP